MKKILAIVTLIFCMISVGQAREKEYKNGEVTAYYDGNKAEIVDNVNNVCIIVTVERSKNSLGEWVYEFACNNKRTKGLTKLALHSAITAGISAVATPAAAGAVASVVNTIAAEYYNDVCEYFAE